MKYNYAELFSLFNLQHKEIKDVVEEAQKALENIEYNRHLLERHIQITLRLQEIRTRLEVINSRTEEIKGDQRLFNLGMQALNELQFNSSVKDTFEARQPLVNKMVVSENGSSGGSLNPDNNPTNGTAPSQTQQMNLTRRSELAQLEILELINLQVKLKNQKSYFEAELATIEQQLTTRGIGAAQG